MKKQRRKSNAAKRKQGAEATPKPETLAAQKSAQRRDVLRRIGRGGVLAGIFGVGALFSVRSVRATMTEQDLSRIGNGTPAVVQIHDPSCGLCRQLQRETRAALEGFDPEELGYMVANIRTTEGRALAARHGVEHVTLLLFSGEGDVLNVLHGTRDRSVLSTAFADHLAASKTH